MPRVDIKISHCATEYPLYHRIGVVSSSLSLYELVSIKRALLYTRHDTLLHKFIYLVHTSVLCLAQHGVHVTPIAVRCFKQPDLIPK